MPKSVPVSIRCAYTKQAHRSFVQFFLIVLCLFKVFTSRMLIITNVGTWATVKCQCLLWALAIDHFISVKLYLPFERYYLLVSGKFGCRVENKKKKKPQQQYKCFRIVKHIYRICDTCPTTVFMIRTDMISSIQCPIPRWLLFLWNAIKRHF